ncbi:hypothetical protein [Acanthamoeba castellanii mimivirus]|jgi:hypothetical protein|uniref:Uncharacterized protein R741 n=5 Tax=Mimivirus TaxID=315393 RepID=YR741_MIMIV|nr:hypothetical protein MIMI_gp0800 [Acanthamoeba polyphaga mimivirus]Q5UNZ7.1 RecName: Full=Uncharacterized protein R741 [Acanthamoeba polyphaga mimivirus]AEQ60952.1 hypothetical protein [Acanthamoeba castellanii mamavirus]AHA45091.1 hypothetical protein HIRU_S185 [Hirudovirus strain Sangsue]ALR84364.1 hypothetical protein [Niemeyer virus]AMK62024.1 hypothetical protein [Samba virus]AMZ03186.1 hypothetical protein [Mimivirus Bombay]EJN41151.1 hypothetical protein lvs_R648 [Acanthamoeba poly
MVLKNIWRKNKIFDKENLSRELKCYKYANKFIKKRSNKIERKLSQNIFDDIIEKQTKDNRSGNLAVIFVESFHETELHVCQLNQESESIGQLIKEFNRIKYHIENNVDFIEEFEKHLYEMDRYDEYIKQYTFNKDSVLKYIEDNIELIMREKYEWQKQLEYFDMKLKLVRYVLYHFPKIYAQ